MREDNLVTSDELTCFAPALSAFQGEIETVVKRGEVDMQTKRGRVRYTFADLADMWRVIRIPLARASLSVSQGLAMIDGCYYMKTLVLHSSGQYMLWTAPVPYVGMPGADTASAQAHGSLITYAKRYGLAAALGLTTDDEQDDDGNKYQAEIRQLPQQSTVQQVFADQPQQQEVVNQQVASQQPDQVAAQSDGASDALVFYRGALQDVKAPGLVAAVFAQAKDTVKQGHMTEDELATFKRECANHFQNIGGVR